MAKIIFGIDRYHCKELSPLCPGPSSDGVFFFFFCHTVDFKPPSKTAKKPCDFLKAICLYKLESFAQAMRFAAP